MVLNTGICPSALTPAALRCEYCDNPLGIDAGRPRLSWQIVSSHSARIPLELRSATLHEMNYRFSLKKIAGSPLLLA